MRNGEQRKFQRNSNAIKTIPYLGAEDNRGSQQGAEDNHQPGEGDKRREEDSRDKEGIQPEVADNHQQGEAGKHLEVGIQPGEEDIRQLGEADSRQPEEAGSRQLGEAGSRRKMILLELVGKVVVVAPCDHEQQRRP